MIATFVLIIIFTGYYKGGITTVEGYPTFEACAVAGSALRAAYAKNESVFPSYVCIPGPPVNGGTKP